MIPALGCASISASGPMMAVTPVSEHWFDGLEPAGDVPRVAAAQRGLCDRADEAGQEWALEVYDPSRDRTARVASSMQPPPAGTQRIADPVALDPDDSDSFLRLIAQVLGFSGG